MIQRSYVISRVLGTRDKISKASARYAGKVLSIEDFNSLVACFAQALPKDIDRGILKDSLIHLAERELKATALRDEAWRLAGNVERLQQFHAVPPWNRQIADEYVPVQVLGVTVERREDRSFVELALRVLAGTPAPLVLRKTWSLKFCAMLSGRLGFAKPWELENTFVDVRQFVGLRFYALIEQRLCGVRPNFEHLWLDEKGKRIMPASCYTYNRDLIKMRNREFSQFACPANYPTTVACHTCVVGLVDCPLAVHALTFKRRKCRFCKKEAWFDNEVTKTMCINCSKQQAKGELL